MLQVVVLVLSKLVKWRGPYGSSASSDSIWGMISTGKYLGSWIHSVCLLQPMEGLKVPYKSRKLGFFSTSIERILVFVQFVLHPMAWTPNGFAMAGELLRFRIRVVSWAPWSQVSQVVSSPVGFVVMTQLQDWVINSSTWSMTLFLGIRAVTSLFVVHSYSFMHVFNFVGETVRWLVFPSVHMRVPTRFTASFFLQCVDQVCMFTSTPLLLIPLYLGITGCVVPIIPQRYSAPRDWGRRGGAEQVPWQHSLQHHHPGWVNLGVGMKICLDWLWLIWFCNVSNYQSVVSPLLADTVSWKIFVGSTMPHD